MRRFSVASIQGLAASSAQRAFPIVSSSRAVSLTWLVSGVLAGAYGWGADASGQTAGPTPALQEIIVTAQKRAENLEDVPISVVAVSAQQLKDAGVTDIRSLTVLTPGLTVTSEANENVTTARIRGIGTVGDNPGLESSVGVNIDGVYRPRNGVAFGDLGEIEQIEVLYGPQGELFGKNNDAGVINVTTKRPSRSFGATAEITGGNFNDREFKGSITGPLGDIVAGRLYFGFQQQQGYLQVNDGVGPSTQNDTNGRHDFTTRGQLSITPGEDLDVLLIADLSKRDESCCGAVVEYPGPFQGLVNEFASNPLLGGRVGALGDPALADNYLQTQRLPNSYTANANQPINQYVRDMGFSAEVNWNSRFGKLTSITAWRDNTEADGNDTDFAGIDLLTYPNEGSANSTDFKQFSEELRLAGKEGPLSWLVGGFFNNEILATRTLALTGDQFETYISAVASEAGGLGFDPSLVSQVTGNGPGVTFASTGYDDSYKQDSRSFALFTNETYTIVQGLDLTVGLRGTEERKTATASYGTPSYGDYGGGPGCGALLNNLATIAGLPAASQAFLVGYGCYTGLNPLFNGTGFDQSKTENNLSGTVKVDYHFNEEVMAYASWANGYKAGGFNLSRVTQLASAADPLGIAPNYNTAFPRETVDSGEIGVKSTLLDRTLRVNAAVFYQQYHDFQLNTFTGIQFVVTSLPRVVSKGVDLDFAWATPLSGLTLSGGVTQDLTNIDNFGPPETQADFCGGAGNTACTYRESNRLSFAPLWSGALAASFQVPLSGTIGVRTSLEEKYSSAYNTGSDLDPRKIQGAFGLLNARLGIGALDESWALEVWGANLTDKYYYGVAFDSPFQYNTIASYLTQPRTYGATVRVKFK
jgi:outer membrane receptor protein involved in Fe transport